MVFIKMIVRAMFITFFLHCLASRHNPLLTDYTVNMNYAEKLDSSIRASYISSVKELSMLWIRMGLSKEEIETRITTVVMKISDITTEMVECDRENTMKLEEACCNLKKDIRVMKRKLKKPGDSDTLSEELTLLEQLKLLKSNLSSLEEERNEIMGEFR